jgi:ketosteroid isomerase-like protein
MSQENVEIVRRIFDAWNQGDFDAAWSVCDPDLVIDRSRSLVDSRIYRGTEEVEQFWSDWRDTWESACWEIDEYIEAGDDVVVLGRFYGRGAESGVAVEANVTQVMTVRNGKLVRGVLFQSRSDALEAAGLRD